MHPETSPDTKFLLFGENYRHKTQFLCWLMVCKGVSVYISHSLTVASPDPLAQCSPLGENYVHNTFKLF